MLKKKANTIFQTVSELIQIASLQLLYATQSHQGAQVIKFVLGLKVAPA
jgi:hypothetical protein